MISFRTIAIAVVLSSIGVALAEDAPKLEPWVHSYYWEEFTLSQEAPMTPDGRYRLKIVSKNGDVEVFYSPTPETRQVLVVKPMPKQFRKGDRPPTLVVKASDAVKQSATLRELKIK